MQRHAVHGGGHAVLADAVMDIAPAEYSPGAISTMPLVRVLTEPVRSAEPPMVVGQDRIDDFQRHLGRLARGDAKAFPRSAFFLSSFSAARERCRNLARERRVEFRVPVHRLCAARSRLRAPAFPCAPIARQAERTSLGMTNGS